MDKNFGDIWHRIDGSWSAHDAIRHYMYEEISAELGRLAWDMPHYDLVEIGSRDTTSSPIRIMVEILGGRVSASVGNWPEVNIEAMPYLDKTWDIFIADQVLEHVQKPWLAAADIHRVVRQDGIAIIATPYLHPIHPAPLDCWRISPHGYDVLFPESQWKTIARGSWGNRAICREVYASNVSRGMTHEWISVAQARTEIPSFDTPSDGLHPIVIWYIGRKR